MMLVGHLALSWRLFALFVLGVLVFAATTITDVLCPAIIRDNRSATDYATATISELQKRLEHEAARKVLDLDEIRSDLLTLEPAISASPRIGELAKAIYASTSSTMREAWPRLDPFLKWSSEDAEMPWIRAFISGLYALASIIAIYVLVITRAMVVLSATPNP